MCNKDQIIHLTFTGKNAGLAFCEVNREQAEKEGARFIHPPYAPFEEWTFKASLCPACKGIYID